MARSVIDQCMDEPLDFIVAVSVLDHVLVEFAGPSLALGDLGPAQYSPEDSEPASCQRVDENAGVCPLNVVVD